MRGSRNAAGTKGDWMTQRVGRRVVEREALGWGCGHVISHSASLNYADATICHSTRRVAAP
jgi:hypothetical protein